VEAGKIVYFPTASQRATLSLLILLFAALPAFAQGANSGDAATVTIDRATCARLMRHTPAPDVAFKPGVDVRGKPVASADHDGYARIEPPDEIVFDIEVDLRDLQEDAVADPASRAGRFLDHDAKLGRARVNLKDGRAYYNGQPLTSEAQARLAVLCQERFRQ
jgi:hypothetical protein